MWFGSGIWKGVLYEAEGNAADGLADYNSDDSDYCLGYGFWQFADDRLCVPGGIRLLAGGAGSEAVHCQQGKEAIGCGDGTGYAYDDGAYTAQMAYDMPVMMVYVL